MPEKKGTSKKQEAKKGTGKKREAKKDVIDFIKDAAEDNQRVSEFLQEASKEGANEEDLCRLLHEWGYNGVSVKDCTVILHAIGRGAWRTEAKAEFDRDY